jgi:hypothetical protein
MGAVEAVPAIEPLCKLWCIPASARDDWLPHTFKLLGWFKPGADALQAFADESITARTLCASSSCVARNCTPGSSRPSWMIAFRA